MDLISSCKIQGLESSSYGEHDKTTFMSTHPLVFFAASNLLFRSIDRTVEMYSNFSGGDHIVMCINSFQWSCLLIVCCLLILLL